MTGRISNFFREYIVIWSIILLLVGFVLLLIGLGGFLSIDMIKNIFEQNEEFWQWGFYFLVVGFIIFISGIYYLFSYMINRKFILNELEIKKRSEFLKKHLELRNTVKKMPSKYQKMLKDKESELMIK
jgi:uncharacterized membrane protein